MFAHTIYILKVKKIEALQKIKFCKAPIRLNYSISTPFNRSMCA